MSAQRDPGTPGSRRRRLVLEIRGAVQGVGFRPAVYRLATDLGLDGWVLNDNRGVFLEIEGPEATLQELLERLPRELPPRAVVHSLETAWLDPLGHLGFRIRHSDASGAPTTVVLPDLATCEDCLTEILDPEDRRFGYPFTNCTNCGPRFTIVRELPYDRPHTSMAGFEMCPRCRGEYEEPSDRRFHAQPNACPLCGPQLRLLDREGRELARGGAALDAAVSALAAGTVLAVKGLGGFHLMVDAGDDDAVRRLRRRKAREEKPLAVMVGDLGAARALCDVPIEAATLLSSPEAPIVLLERRPGEPRRESGIAPSVAPGNPRLGLMLPYTPLHHLLLRRFGRPVVATSGNLTDEPICVDNLEARERLAGIADRFLEHDRPIERHADDSVVMLAAGAPRLLRRARGFAPMPLVMRRPLATVLAVGAHLKSTVALSIERNVFVSQHLGDLETAQSLAAFERVVADFLRLYGVRPVALAHDLHPGYLSTRWVREVTSTTAQGPFAELAGLPRVAVQHHHAHLASCLSEHRVEGRALGVTWDGTGWGLDRTVWGGEILLGDCLHFERFAALVPFRLPGGDAAVREPRRVALALLWELLGEEVLERSELRPVAAFTRGEHRLLGQVLSRGIGSPWTTSAGRLFDAVASLLDLSQRSAFEGQAAMAVEQIADPGEHGAYPLPVGTPAGRRPATHPPVLELDWRDMLRALLEDLLHGQPAARIAARFHNSLAAAITEVARRAAVARVALTGGCFQNRLLLERTRDALASEGFEILVHRQVPTNDGGISLGQVAVATARLERAAGN